jgi:hypothetical protein
MELFSNATFTQLNSKLPPALKSREGEKSWAMQHRLETFEDLDEWPDSVAMAQHLIQAGPLDHPQSKSKQNSKKKRQGLKSFNVFITTAVIAPKSSTATVSRCLGRNSTLKHHLEPDDSMIVKCNISSTDDCRSFNIANAHFANTFNLYKRSTDLANLVEKWPHLSHVPIGC